MDVEAEQAREKVLAVALVVALVVAAMINRNTWSEGDRLRKTHHSNPSTALQSFGLTG